MDSNPESQLIGNMEVVRTRDTLSLRFSRPFRRKASLILLAMMLIGSSMVAGGSRLLLGELDRFTVDLLLLLLGGGLLLLSAWGLSHVARHGLGWTVLDRRRGIFRGPGHLLGFPRTIALADIVRVEIFRKESSEERSTGYGNVVERVGLIIRNRRRLFFPWGTRGGPDRPVEIASLLSSFLTGQKESGADAADVREGLVDTLLPPKAGPYIRAELRRLEISKGRTNYATYRMGSQSIFVELGICDNPSAAHLALNTARSELSSEFPNAPPFEESRDDCLFLSSENPRGAFTAWTHGRYYYSAHTGSGKPDLDAFVQVLRATCLDRMTPKKGSSCGLLPGRPE